MTCTIYTLLYIVRVPTRGHVHSALSVPSQAWIASRISLFELTQWMNAAHRRRVPVRDRGGLESRGARAVCGQCGMMANTDVNGAENTRYAPIRTNDGSRQVTQSCLTEFEDTVSTTRGDSTGWLAQLVVNLFRRGERGQCCGQGTFTQHVSSHES